MATGMEQVQDTGWGMPPEDQPSYDRAHDPEPYWPHGLCFRKPGVAEGRMVELHQKDCRTYPEVAHEWKIYLSANCDGVTPANLMVFLDGRSYIKHCHIPEVVDNMVAAGELPPVVCVFHEPGDKGPGLPVYGGDDNRSLEYDSVDDVFATYLIDELLPEAARIHPITDDPNRRAIFGFSSGGNAAFAVAWHRSDSFRQVVSSSGSFANIRGGHEWPYRVRMDKRRPLRVWLCSGKKDLDIVFGDWVTITQAMASALAYKGYDYQCHIGEGGHNLRYTASVMPDILRWIWR